MVFCGKPSRGCENCRRLHVKCDEQRPCCSRCSRLKLACTGYRDQLAMAFRDETGAVQAKLRSSNKRGTRVVTVSSLASPGFGSPLLPTLEDEVLSHFHQAITATLDDASHAYYLHTQLPALYFQSTPQSALHLSTQAISYAVASKVDRTFSQLAEKRYRQSILAISRAIQDPHQVNDNQILYAVLLLCGYEVIVCAQEIPAGWGAHIDGVAAILKLRCSTWPIDPFSQRLYLYARRAIVLSHIQISKPICPLLIDMDGLSSLFDDPEDRLISKIAKVPNLQCLANDLLGFPPQNRNEDDIFDLLQNSRALDSDIANWTKTLSSSWSYKIAIGVGNTRISSPSVKYTPSHIHRYTTISIARVWNLYRTSRLILQSIILRCVLLLSCQSRFSEQDNSIITAEGNLRDLVNDMCASVPFLLGEELSSMKLSPRTDLSAQSTLWSQTVREEASPEIQTGRYSLIWPLFIGRSVSTISESQRKWISLQLQRIGEHGEPLAGLVARSESRTLSGGPENLRFPSI